jgi:peptidyl-prolyl cis-trans isomerase D
MLKILRKKGVMKKLLWVVAIVIIISFGFLGTASVLDNSGKHGAGRIFGRKVTLEDFQKSLDHARMQAILRYGENFYKIQSFLDLEAEAWDRLILLQETRRRGLKVSDKEIISAIQDKEFFKRNGQFDPYLYEDIVRYVFKVKPRTFEEGIRESLLFSKLFEDATAGITLSEEEIRERYKEANEKTQVDYVLLTPEQYRGQAALTEEEIQKYYEEHKEDFRVPETVNIQYLHLKYPEAETAEEAAEAPAIDTVKAQANLLAMELLLTPDLKEVGKKYDLAAEETGPFSREQPNLKLGWSYELLGKSFELKENEISAPIETPQGYYILKLKERRGSYVPDYAQAYNKVKDALTTRKAATIARQKAEEHLQKIKDTMNAAPEQGFVETVKSLNLSLQQTPVFSRGEYLPQVGISRNFQEAAFDLVDDEDKISDVVEAGTGYAILGLNSYVAVDEEKFAQEKDEFAEAIITERKLEEFNDFVARLKAKANLQSNLPKRETAGQPQG